MRTFCGENLAKPVVWVGVACLKFHGEKFHGWQSKLRVCNCHTVLYLYIQNCHNGLLDNTCLDCTEVYFQPRFKFYHAPSDIHALFFWSLLFLALFINEGCSSASASNRIMIVQSLSQLHWHGTWVLHFLVIRHICTPFCWPQHLLLGRFHVFVTLDHICKLACQPRVPVFLSQQNS